MDPKDEARSAINKAVGHLSAAGVAIAAESLEHAEAQIKSAEEAVESVWESIQQMIVARTLEMD